MCLPACQIFNANKGENFRCTLASTLARLLRASPPLVPYVLDKFGMRLFMMGGSPASPNTCMQINSCNL